MKKKSSKKAKYDKVDNVLNVWFTERRAENTRINQMLLSTEATLFANRLGIQDFKASNSIVEKFKKRHSIVCKTLSGESSSVDKVICNGWVKETLPGLIANYEAKDVFNADESALFYRALRVWPSCNMLELQVKRAQWSSLPSKALQD